MKHYRVVMIEEFDSDGCTKASYFEVQRRSLFKWWWRHVKFYDRREDAMHHLVRLNIIGGKRKRVTLVSQ